MTAKTRAKTRTRKAYRIVVSSADDSIRKEYLIPLSNRKRAEKVAMGSFLLDHPEILKLGLSAGAKTERVN